MTVIDVSERKQRQLIAEWKAEQEHLARRELARTDPAHTRLAHSLGPGPGQPRGDGEVVDGEQLRELGRGDTGETGREAGVQRGQLLTSNFFFYFFFHILDWALPGR